MSIEPEVEAVIRKLAAVLARKKIRFVMIGAIVPQILIDLKEADGRGHGFRGTMDVDCAVEVESWSAYEDLMAELVAAGFVRPSSGPEHRLQCGRIPVDLLPYGESLLEERILIWPHSGRRMNMSGLRISLESSHEERIGEGVSVPVPPASLAVYLKLVTFLDRNDSKDLADAVYILAHYEDVSVSERRFDPTVPEDLTYEVRGAFLIGRELSRLIPPSEVKQIEPLFLLVEDPDGRVAGEAARAARMSALNIAGLMSAFRRGLGTAR